jgi:hypothetical protein
MSRRGSAGEFKASARVSARERGRLRRRVTLQRFTFTGSRIRIFYFLYSGSVVFGFVFTGSRIRIFYFLYSGSVVFGFVFTGSRIRIFYFLYMVQYSRGILTVFMYVK